MKWLQIMMMTKMIEVVEIGPDEALTMLDRLGRKKKTHLPP